MDPKKQAEQMAAARLLASEFRKAKGSGGGGRGGMNNGGSSSRPGGVGRAAISTRYDAHPLQMNRPTLASSRSIFTQAEVNRAKVQPSAVTRVNPALAGWLAGSNTPQASPATPATLAASTMTTMSKIPAMPAKTIPARSTAPKGIDKDLASWLTPAPNPVAAPPKETPISHSSSTVLLTKMDGPETSRVATVGNVKAIPQSIALPPSLKQDVDANPETTVHSKPSGLGKSLRVAYDAKVIKEQNDSNLNARASALLVEDVESATQSQSNYNGQASRILERVDIEQDAETSAAKTEASAVEPEPKFGTVEWALAQLNRGLELPGFDAFHARKAQVSKNKPGVVSITDHHSGSINNTENVIQRQETTNEEKAAEPLTEGSDCNCPKRSHPIIGLAASCCNTDSDGDHDLVRMQAASDAVKDKFAVNVVLHEHSNLDCPKLLRAAAKFPLHFGASPAVVDDPDDHLQAIRWKDSNGLSGPSISVPVRKINSYGPQNNLAGPSHNSSGPPLAGAPVPQPTIRRRGINDSMWA